MRRARVCKACAMLTARLCICTGLELKRKHCSCRPPERRGDWRRPASVYTAGCGTVARHRPLCVPWGQSDTHHPHFASQVLENRNASPRRKGSAKVTGSFRSNQETKDVK